MQANGSSSSPSISADGRYVAFSSLATNLVPGDTNAKTDVFVRDLVLGETERVSVASDGTQANGPSSGASISADGRFVAFSSLGTNLVTNTDTNGTDDVFLHDRLNGETILVSRTPGGSAGNGQSRLASLSPDSGFVAFTSKATDLSSHDSNLREDIYVFDVAATTLTLESVANGSSPPAPGNKLSGAPMIASGGRYLVYESHATDLVSGDTNGKRDVFLRDRLTGNARVSKSIKDPPEVEDGDSGSASISDTADHLAFTSFATNLVDGDTNGFIDVFVFAGAGELTLASLADDGAQANAGSGQPAGPTIGGRYVAFPSPATNLAGTDTGNGADIFVRDLAAERTELISVAVGGTTGNAAAGGPDITRDGRFVAFHSGASDLVPPGEDTNGTSDVFVRDRGAIVPDEQTFGNVHAINPSVFLADPVNSATGFFHTSGLDIGLPGAGIPFSFARHYTSASTTETEIGRGWSHSYAVSLEIEWDGDVVLHGEDGQRVVYTKQADGSFSSVAGGRSTLEAVAGGYQLTRKDLVSYSFDTDGRLTALVDRSGEGLSFTYDAAGNIDVLTDSAGREIDFTHNASGLLTTIDLPDGRQVSYGYTDGRLTQFTDPRGGTVAYSYDAEGRLTSIVDQNGDTSIENIYGLDGQVTEQIDALGNHSFFTWDEGTGTATMTDASGGVWTDVYDGNVLQSRTDPLGNTVSFEWEDDLNLPRITDQLDNDWQLEFDARGNLTRRVPPAPFTFDQEFTYDIDNNLTSFTDARGNTWSYDYDASGRLTTVTRPDAATLNFTYTADGLLATMTDFRGKTTTYTYDATGNLTAVETPLGHTTTYAYDAAGRVTSVVEPRGNEPGATPADFTTTYTYDDAGNLLTETNPLGNTTTYAYDPAGNLTKITDALNRETTFTYNAAGELTSETAPGGRTTGYTYDAQGRLTAVTAPLGRKTTYAYDDAGRLAGMVTPRGNEPGATPADFEWTYAYDAAGRLTQTTDPLGGTVAHAYDELGRLTSTTDQRSKTTTFGYDANGNRTSIVDPLANTTSYVYDDLDRLTSVTDPRGKTTTHTYDANGNLTATTTPLGNQQTFSYDDDNRLTGRVDPRGNAPGATPADFEWITAYDAAGNRILETDPLGNQTQWESDEAGRLTKQIDALGRATVYAYDALGRTTKVTAPDLSDTSYGYGPAGDLTSRTDALNHTTGYDYDGAGRLIQTTSPIGQVWTYGYDAADNQTTIVDAAGNSTPANPNDGTTSFTFDALDRLTAIDYSDTTPDVTFTYDAAGNRTGMIDGQGTQTYLYDDAGRLTQVTRGLDVLSYSYNAAGNITGRTYPDTTQITLGYDDDGRLDSVTEGSRTTSNTYDEAANIITITNANATSETRAYDKAGRLSEIRHTKGTADFASFTYTRDAVGNPSGVVTTDGPITYEYDLRDRLIEACFTPSCSGLAPDGGDAFVRYTYDAVGNRLTQARPLGTTTYTYDAADQLTAAAGPTGTVTYDYDPNGNQIRAGGRTYTWDLADRLASAQAPGASLTYAYDGEGRRAAATRADLLPPQTTTYTWDTTSALGDLVLERTGAGGLLRRHVHGADLISTTGPDPVNPAVTRTVVLHPDGVGSTAAVTDAAGDTDWRYTYDPYGEPRRVAQDDVLAAQNRMRFTGELADTETGLYHLRARQYHPGTERFLSTDPVERAVGEPYLSAYTFVDGRPTVLVDPSGLRAQEQTPQAGVSLVAGGAAAACRAAPVVCGGFVLIGGIVVFDPFDYSEVFEDLGGWLSDWVGGADRPAPTPTPVPTPGPLLPPISGGSVETEHRGRIQVQGPDMNPEISWSWTRSSPPTAQEALMHLSRLQASLSKRQAEIRDEAFARAADLIRRCPAVGGCPPPGRSFRNRNVPARLNGARVDIEIFKGVAFVG